MISLNRPGYSSSEAFFFHLYNDLGAVNLEVAIFENGYWSKWLSYEFLSHNTDIRVWRGLTGKQFMEKANNRTILDIELLFDWDEGFDKSQDRSDIQIVAERKIRCFKENGLYCETYFSGSKSIHCSILFPQLRDYTKHHRRLFKDKMIGQFEADLSKSADRCMIALEGVAHWKTGNIKEVIKIE